MLNKYLIKQFELHQNIHGQDVIKFIYQATFGASHLSSNIDMMLQLFKKEYEVTPALNGILLEEISGDFVRINISVWKYQGLDENKLFDLFVETSKSKIGTKNEFNKNIQDAIDTINYLNLDNGDKIIDEINQLMKDGITQVHHSIEYQTKELPHYRVVRKDLLNA